MRNQEFLILPPDDVAKLLSSDDLNVPNEETIFHALVMWAKHDTANRRKHLAKLLAHIKLPLMAPQVNIILYLCSIWDVIQVLLITIWSSIKISLHSNMELYRKPRKSTVGVVYAVGGLVTVTA